MGNSKYCNMSLSLYFSFALILCLPAASQADMLSFSTYQLASVSSSSPDSTSSELYVSPTQQSLVRFENVFGAGAGQIPLNSTINSASLTFYSHDPNGYYSTPSAHRMLTSWDAGITWNNAGAGIQADDLEASIASQSPTAIGDGRIEIWNDGAYVADAEMWWDQGAAPQYSAWSNILFGQSGTRTAFGPTTDIRVRAWALAGEEIFDLTLPRNGSFRFEVAGTTFFTSWLSTDASPGGDDILFELDAAGDVQAWSSGETNNGWAFLSTDLGTWSNNDLFSANLSVDFTPVPEPSSILLLGLGLLALRARSKRMRKA